MKLFTIMGKKIELYQNFKKFCHKAHDTNRSILLKKVRSSVPLDRGNERSRPTTKEVFSKFRIDMSYFLKTKLIMIANG